MDDDDLDREGLNALRAFRNGEIDGLMEGMTCPRCGQWFAYADLGDVLHHDRLDHDPLPVVKH